MITYKKLYDLRPDRKERDPAMMARIYDISFNCLSGVYSENLGGLNVDVTQLRLSLLERITGLDGRVSLVDLLNRVAVINDINFRASHTNRAIYSVIIYSAVLLWVMDLALSPQIVQLTSSDILGYSYTDVNPVYGFRLLT